MTTRYEVTVAAMALREAMVSANISTISIPGMVADLTNKVGPPRKQYCDHGYPLEDKMHCSRCCVGELHIHAARAAIRARDKKKKKEG